VAFTREQRFTVEPAGQPGSICLFDNELLLSAYFTSQLFCASPRGNCAAEPSDELPLLNWTDRHLTPSKGSPIWPGPPLERATG
jgi:hypothetical protein